MGKHDFVAALVDAEIEEKEAESYFEYFDLHKTGWVDFNDFCGATLQFRGSFSNFQEEKIREAFFLIDFDGDGVISANDFSKSMDMPLDIAQGFINRAAKGLGNARKGKFVVSISCTKHFISTHVLGGSMPNSFSRRSFIHADYDEPVIIGVCQEEGY